MPYKTLPEKFAEIASKFPAKTAVIEYNPPHTAAYTYAELEKSAESIAAFLISKGCSFANVGLSLANSCSWIKIFFGILKSSSACVPIDGNLSADEFTNILSHAECKAFFCSKEAYLKIKDSSALLPQLKTIIITDPGSQEDGIIKFSGVEKDYSLNANPPALNIEDAAAIVYTSGTTSRPKGVVLSHKNLYADFLSLYNLGIYNENDNTLAILPFHHTYSLMATILLPLFSGSSLTIVNSLRADAIIAALNDAKITMFTGVPELFKGILSGIEKKINSLSLIPGLFIRLMRNSLWILKGLTGVNLTKTAFRKLRLKFGRKLRFMVSGGAKLDKRTALGLMKFGFELVEGYGLTETSPVATMAVKQLSNISSAGKPIQGVKINIIAKNASGGENPAKPGETGEIIISGDNVMQGYYKSPGLTAEAIRNGWFYSGDLGYLDKRGYLYITGRSKDIIVLSSGKNIYPDEVEAYYKQSPYIKDICVIDLQNPSGDTRLYGVIIPDHAYFKKTGEVNISTTIKWEVENLSKGTPAFRRIMGFIITREDFPKTALGKLKRYMIKSQYRKSGFSGRALSREGAPSAEEALPFTDELGIRVAGILEKELNRNIRLSDNLELDLGIDSLGRVNLGMALANSLNIKIPDETISKAYTVQELIASVRDLTKNPGNSGIAMDNEPLKWSQSLAIPPAPETLKNILARENILRVIVSCLGLFMLKSAVTALFFLRARGTKNLPRNGPFLICPNHNSFLDGFFISASLPYRLALKTSFLGFNFKLYRMPVARALVKLLGIIPINPAENLVESMRACAFLLRQNRVICIFPEGKRGINEEPDEFRKGIGILVEELKIPVVPVYIKGTLAAWPRGQPLPKPYPVSVTFGGIFEPNEAGKAADKEETYANIAQELRRKVTELSK